MQKTCVPNSDHGLDKNLSSCNNKYQTLKISNLFKAKTRTNADEKSILLHFYIVYICVVTGCSLMGRLSSFSGVMVSYKSAVIARKG